MNKFVLLVASLVVLCTQAFAQPSGIWISKEELAALPTSGTAWNSLKAKADQSCGSVDLANQDQSNNVCILAKALVFARTGQASYRTDTVAALQSIVNLGTYSGRALALGRELGAYVIAADLIDLKNYNSSLDGQFRAKIKSLLTTSTSGGPSNLIDCHEDRPNNWGTHCGGARAAVAAYLGDSQQLARVAQVFKGWLGDRSSYSGFSYGDTSWQCNPSAPVGINPTGCTKNGYNIDGVLPDDQRRSGGFSWPPSDENYVYEALQGALMQAVILQRFGYDAFAWENRALLRAFNWLHNVNNFPASGDDSWLPHLINYFYGASFPAKTPTTSGKNMGYTDWTHSGDYSAPPSPYEPPPYEPPPTEPPPPSGDTTAPVISGVNASLVTSTDAAIMWSTNEAATCQVEYGTSASYGKSTTPTSGGMTQHSTKLSGLSAGTTYNYRVRSADAAGNLAVSGNYTFKTPSGSSTPPPAPAGGCVDSSSGWKNAAFPLQSGTFTAQFDATPNSSTMDGVIGLSAGSASDFRHLAPIVRFYTNNRIEARNYDRYAASTAIAYKAGVSYRFRLVIRVASGTYDIYVTPAGGSEVTLGLNYRFRAEQTGVTSLANWATISPKSTHKVCNFSIY
jgi:hypothetical protein